MTDKPSTLQLFKTGIAMAVLPNRAPMSDEQRKAMFARMDGGGGSGRGYGPRRSNATRPYVGYMDFDDPRTSMELSRQGSTGLTSNITPMDLIGDEIADYAIESAKNNPSKAVTVAAAILAAAFGVKGFGSMIRQAMKQSGDNVARSLSDDAIKSLDNIAFSSARSGYSDNLADEAVKWMDAGFSEEEAINIAASAGRKADDIPFSSVHPAATPLDEMTDPINALRQGATGPDGYQLPQHLFDDAGRLHTTIQPDNAGKAFWDDIDGSADDLDEIVSKLEDQWAREAAAKTADDLDGVGYLRAIDDPAVDLAREAAPPRSMTGDEFRKAAAQEVGHKRDHFLYLADEADRRAALGLINRAARSYQFIANRRPMSDEQRKAMFARRGKSGSTPRRATKPRTAMPARSLTGNGRPSRISGSTTPITPAGSIPVSENVLSDAYRRDPDFFNQPGSSLKGGFFRSAATGEIRPWTRAAELAMSQQYQPGGPVMFPGIPRFNPVAPPADMEDMPTVIDRPKNSTTESAAEKWKRLAQSDEGKQKQDLAEKAARLRNMVTGQTPRPTRISTPQNAGNT